MGMVYKTDLDYTVLDNPKLTTEALLKYIESAGFFTPFSKEWSLQNIYKFVSIICRMEKVEPTPEQFLYILCNCHRLLNEACAGAGKTTMSKYKIIVANLCYGIPSDHIIAITYNRHAAEDIEHKYKSLARIVNEKSRGRTHIGTDVRFTTMHAWSLMWVEEYKQQLGLRNVQLLEESDEQKFMQATVKRFLKNNGKENMIISDTMIQNLLSLNNWIRETLTGDESVAWNVCSSRVELKMFSDDELKELFKDYVSRKKLLNRVDYQDIIDYFWTLLQDKDVIARIRRAYTYFVVDEYQDITPSMLRIFHHIMEGNPGEGIEKFENGYLTCIGDGDQSIYGFRGTDSENCIRFKESYPDAKITAMSVNRRCDRNILSYAQRIIESNVNRIKKPIRGLHDGGTVSVHYYNSETDELRKVVDILRGLPTLNNTCICYRNLLSSQFLVVKLLEAGIPFNTRRGVKPFSDIYSRSIDDLLTLLENPNIPRYAEQVMYKMVPRGTSYTKDNLNMLYKAHQDELKNSRRGHFVEPKNFWEYGYGDWYRQNGFKQAIDNLHMAHLAIRNNQPMCAFMPVLIEQLKRYFINSLRKNLFSDKLSDEYVHFIDTYYTQNIPYRSFKKEREKLLLNLEDSKYKGVVLTTMHGLKGLEFDNVIVLDMDDNLYPGNELKSKALTEQQREKIEWEARRLLYVTVTRAKHNLTLLFNNNCPSRYIKFFVESDDLVALYGSANKIPNLSTGEDLSISNKTIDVLASNDDEFIFEEDMPSSLETAVNKSDTPVSEKGEASVGDELDTMFALDEETANAEDISIDSLFDVEDSNSIDVSEFDNMFDGDDSAMQSTNLFDSTPENIDDMFSNALNQTEKKKVSLPWAEDPLNNKPKLTAILDLMKEKEK